MGLDSYLYLQTSVPIADRFNPINQSTEISKADKVAGLLGVNPGLFEGYDMEIKIPVAYWRKFNALHGYMVKLDGGKDHCQEIYLDKDQVTKLLTICKQISAATDKKRTDLVYELMPPTAGFFFGSMDIDEWFMQNIEHTIKRLELVMSHEFKRWDQLIYQASW